MEKLVSIIVPVYNVEKYIEHCVKSLMCQDYSNIEIILVDDGTPDNSGAIIDSLAESDKRIRVIHKENEGVSSARNAGLEIATGEYVTFVDGDDYVDIDYVSYFLNLAITEKSDIVMNFNNYTLNKKHRNEFETVTVIDSIKAAEYIYLEKINVAVWNKMYKTSLLKENDIAFDKHYWYGEGMLFNIQCLQYTPKVAIGNRCVYYQVYNTDSAMRSFKIKNNYCGIRSMYRQKEIWKESNSDLEKAWIFHNWCFNNTTLYGLVKTNTVKEHKEEYKYCIKNLRAGLTIPLKVDIGFKKKIIFMLISLFPITMSRFMLKREKKQVKRYQ